MLITRSVHREVHVHVDVQMPRSCLVTKGVLNVAIDGLGRITLGLTNRPRTERCDQHSESLRVGTTRCARGAGSSVEAGSPSTWRGVVHEGCLRAQASVLEERTCLVIDELGAVLIGEHLVLEHAPEKHEQGPQHSGEQGVHGTCGQGEPDKGKDETVV